MSVLASVESGVEVGSLGAVIAAGVAIAVLTSVLSVLVVLKRLAFIGQGVSHAGFGGIGLAFVLGLTGVHGDEGLAGAALAQHLGLFGLILVFCVAAALGIARLSRSGRTGLDTAIGIVLVFAMAGGMLLYQLAEHRAEASGHAPPPEMEDVLFGSLTSVGWIDAVIAWAVCVVSLGVLAWLRRPMLFATFDESAAEAFGVRIGRMQTVLLVALAVAVVVTMQLAGVVLATAMLVLPGAAGLRLSDRLGLVVVWSVVIALAGTLAGLMVSVETGWQTGPSVVLTLVALYAGACGAARLRTR